MQYGKQMTCKMIFIQTDIKNFEGYMAPRDIITVAHKYIHAYKFQYTHTN